MARPRGFIDNWKPKAHIQEIIDNANHIINTCGITPITLRQLFYMMNTDFGTPKTQKFYKNMCEYMNKARRAGMVRMHHIRDDGLTRRSYSGWDSQEELIDYIKSQTDHFNLNKRIGQPRDIYVWCETAGMVEQVHDAVVDYHIPVLSSGGFDSVTTKHNLAMELSERNDPVILHLGDYDPSGVHMYGSLDEDLNAFLDHFGGSVELRRIAVTPEQGEEWNLPTAPVKDTDNRSFDGNQTIQCEAIRPSQLRELVIREVESEMDMDIFRERERQELRIRKNLTDIFEDLGLE